jgi:L-2-hydroxyglutarate oxidase
LESAEILVIGAGVLGVSIAYWLSTLYDCRIIVVDKEESIAAHASSRNTGVIHRPFYLNPKTKKLFAKSSRLSYTMWAALARSFGLPWKAVGTLTVAVREADVPTLEQYRAWSEENGMREDEIELLDREGVKALEPEIKCQAGFFSKTDVSVDFGVFTRSIWSLASRNGVVFLGGLVYESAKLDGNLLSVRFRKGRGFEEMRCKFMVNAAGGGALEIAQSLGLARQFASLNFRGEYWIVDEPFASRVGRNIYTPSRYPQYPFLDPHFVVRADGTRQIGPNAALVTGPYVYRGFGLSETKGMLANPMAPKLKLLASGSFLSMVSKEWRSSLSKEVMCDRVREFVPGLKAGMLKAKGVSGVWTSIVDNKGFLPEALMIKGPNSAHILNYNSPGATGAPAFSAMVLAGLRIGGLFNKFRPTTRGHGLEGWDFDAAAFA